MEFLFRLSQPAGGELTPNMQAQNAVQGYVRYM